ncbi:MAG: STAS domain-containing protein [Vicingaceae bacterium]
MSFSFEIKKEDSILIVSLNGNLMNKLQIEDLLDEVEFNTNQGVKKLILNLAEMEYMNSTGLSILINIFTQTRNKGGEVIITNIPEKINQLLVITKLNSIFNIEKTVEDAKKILI